MGSGGSYLGARAVIELLGSRYYNELSDLKIYFAGNNISAQSLGNTLKLCEGKRVSLNVVSKSGTTLEPALAFRVFKDYLEEHYGKEEAAKRIYATTDKARGSLKRLADIEGYECFTVPDDIGGRYSVLTAVGLLPIAAAGFDIDALMNGAREAMDEYFADGDKMSAAAAYAATRYLMYKKGKTVELLSSYEPDFTIMCEWYKQLFGESEGKEKKGLLPTSAIFTTDLHSMGQYIQDGLRLMFETVVRFKRPASDFEIKKDKDDFDGLNYIAGRKLSYVCDQAFAATVVAHLDGGVPNLVVEVDALNEHSVGELIYFFEKSCAISGLLLGVNPFSQPGVEFYKNNMFALMEKPGYEKLAAELRAKTKGLI